ncbi:MAG: M4 family metallopeptidase [Myxococcota bacterium]
MARSSLLLTLGALSLSTLTLSSVQAAPATRVGELLTSAEGVALSKPMPGVRPAVAAFEYLKANRQRLPGGTTDSIMPWDIDAQPSGLTHVIFKQQLQGILVHDSHLVVSLRSRDNVVTRVWGNLYEIPAGFSTRPSLSADQAEDIARQHFGRPDAELEDEVELVLVPHPTPETSLALAYKVHLFEDVSDIAKNRILLIDAQTGASLAEEERVWPGTPAVGQGVGVWGDVKSLNTQLEGTTYVLADATRAMYNATAGTGWIKTYKQPYSTSAALASDADNYFEAAKSEVDAHYYAGVVYEYYRTKHARNSWDNKGSNLLSYTHSSNANNAFWSGSYMEYGDGDGTNFYPFAGDVSVAAHEMTHGVTQSTSNLKYQYQSGALNEAMSDIMAKLEIDTDNWLIGDQVVTQAFMTQYKIWALRDMKDPTFGGLYNPADPMSTYAQPDHMSVFAYLNNTVFSDYGGVHVNSGIINKMAQLLADGGTHYGVTVAGLGRADTAKLFYKVNSATYLATTSDFDHFATQVQKAATDLWGSTSPKVTSVKSALQAIGLLSVNCVAVSETESNNSTSTANSVAAGCSDVTGSIGSTSDGDYFKIVLGAGKTLSTFLRVPYASDFDLYLYKGSSLVTKSVQTGNGQDEVIKVQNTGTTSATLYVLVKRYSGSTGTSWPYTLNVKY